MYRISSVMVVFALLVLLKNECVLAQINPVPPVCFDFIGTGKSCQSEYGNKGTDSPCGDCSNDQVPVCNKRTFIEYASAADWAKLRSSVVNVVSGGRDDKLEDKFVCWSSGTCKQNCELDPVSQQPICVKNSTTKYELNDDALKGGACPAIP